MELVGAMCRSVRCDLSDARSRPEHQFLAVTRVPGHEDLPSSPMS